MGETYVRQLLSALLLEFNMFFFVLFCLVVLCVLFSFLSYSPLFVVVVRSILCTSRRPRASSLVPWPRSAFYTVVIEKQREREKKKEIRYTMYVMCIYIFMWNAKECFFNIVFGLLLGLLLVLLLTLFHLWLRNPILGPKIVQQFGSAITLAFFLSHSGRLHCSKEMKQYLNINPKPNKNECR